MADLPSILGGMAQGFLDFGKSAVDLFGTGGAAVGDLVDTIRTGKVSTKNQDDFRKWLYNTDSVQDAAAKGLGTALNGVQTVTDYIPGIGAVTKNPLFNAGQGALGGLADEFKTYGKDYDLGRAGKRAAVSAGAALASGSLGDALKKSASPLLSSGAVQGLARGATGGAITGGGYAAIDGGDIAQSALQGAGTGALIGGATGAMQDFMPRKATYDMALTDDEKAARIANAKNMLANEQDPERIAELNNQIKDLGGTLADADMAVNSARLTPEQEAYFKNSVMRDSNGNLMPVYHSSPNKFTEFDDARLGDNTAYDNTAFGHFVTNDRDFSSRFRDIDNRGIDGYTMELYADVKNPITHPYMASGKYDGADLDNIVKRYYEATDNPEGLAAIKEWADESGQSLYEAYMDMTVDENPFEAAAAERDLLRNKGYDAVEFVEGLKNELVDGSTDKTPISSYAIFGGNQLKDVNNLAPTENPDIRYSKAAPGQSLEKTLANGDAEINRVGSADVAPVNPKTLPKSLQAAQEYLNESNYINDIEKFAGKPYPKLTNQDFLEYSLSLKNPKDKEFFRTIIDDMVNDGSTTYEKYASAVARNKRLEKLMKSSFDDMDAESLGRYLANNRTKLNNGTIKDIDAELSDRLGIGRSNTLMRDNYLPQDALGAYDPTNSTISIDTNAPEENLVNTLAHERLHSFQTEGDFKRYDKRVTDAYEELSKDLNKYLKTPEETAKRYAFDADYWGNEREQQSRMLQQYLENKGFTRGGLQETNVGEWGNEINPAFDKFFDKLRDLSKRGVALPALAALFGGGAYMASQENDKEKEVK